MIRADERQLTAYDPRRICGVHYATRRHSRVINARYSDLPSTRRPDVARVIDHDDLDGRQVWWINDESRDVELSNNKQREYESV